MSVPTYRQDEKTQLTVFTPTAKIEDTMHCMRSFLSALRPTRLGVLFAVLAGLGVGFWQWNRPPRPRVVLESLGNIGLTGPLRTYFSPDGQLLAIASVDLSGECSLTLWDSHSGDKRCELFQGQCPMAAAFSRDGRTLACSFWAQIRLWDVASGRELATYENNNWLPWYLVFSRQGKLRTVRPDCLFDVAGDKVVANLAWPEADLMLAGDNAILIMCKGDLIKVWDLAGPTLCAHRQIPGIGEMTNLRISSDRRFLIGIRGGWRPHDLFVFDLASGQKQKFPPASMGSTGAAAIAPDGQTLAWARNSSFNLPQKSMWSMFKELLGIPEDPPAGEDVSLHAFPSGQEFFVLKNCGNPVFSPDGGTLAVTGADNNSLALWDFPIRKPIGKMLGQAGLAAVATLLVLNALGWLRRRRSSPADSGSSQHHEVQYLTTDKKSGESGLP